ncbi:hypothetical protein E2C01_010256 [Portunus trituberculatus]|uniref:Uncharacterized protein n=1 Tax=Portunus trituberculatus TaxID=210409 RepID=A0A5B7D7Z9_PORTR|nr:hypothetical protein [Portunus trituberculatus]
MTHCFGGSVRFRTVTLPRHVLWEIPVETSHTHLHLWFLEGAPRWPLVVPSLPDGLADLEGRLGCDNLRRTSQVQPCLCDAAAAEAVSESREY